MPVIDPRFRMLNREARSDFDWMTRFTAAEREFAMMLYQNADDANVLRWGDMESMLGDFYRWLPAEERRAVADSAIPKMVATGRLVILDCGRHAVVPKAQTRGGKQFSPALAEHDSHCSPTPVLPQSDSGLTQEDRPTSTSAITSATRTEPTQAETQHDAQPSDPTRARSRGRGGALTHISEDLAAGMALLNGDGP